ncbi:MAG: LysR family transcriptional regulator, partial [Candidatus Sericytochromatia bacterium]
MNDHLSMEPLKLQWLYAFVLMAGSRNLSEAAMRLEVSQQALSKTLALLEKQLDIKLIERRPWQLTAEGHGFLQEAEALLARTNELEDRFSQALQEHPTQLLEELAIQLEGRLRLGANAYLDPAVLGTCQQLQQQHPRLSFELRVDLVDGELEQLLLAHLIDIAV